MKAQTRRVTIAHRGKKLQARIRQRYTNTAIDTLWKVELVDIRDECLYVSKGTTLVSPASKMSPPLPMKGDLVRILRHKEYYLITEPPRGIAPTTSLCLGGIESGRIVSTIIDAVRFLTFDEELECKTKHLPEEQLEQFLMSWELHLVSRIISSDKRVWDRILKPRMKNWKPKDKLKLRKVMENIVVTKAENAKSPNASDPEERQTHRL